MKCSLSKLVTLAILLPLHIVFSQTTEVGYLVVQQNDSGNASTSVTLSKTSGSSPNFIIRGGNRGDYDMAFANGNDAAAGVLVSCVGQNGRDNTAFGDSIGQFYAAASVDGNAANGLYYIPVNRSPVNSEININVAAGFFPYNRWLGGLAKNAAGTNGGILDALASNSAIRLGFEFKTLGSGVSTLDLRAVGTGHSSMNGVLLVTHAKNEANYATSRSNADGTFTMYVRDNSATGAANEQDPIAFVYLPASSLGTSGLLALGRVNGNASTEVLAGPAVVSKGGTGQWYISIPDQTPETGTLLISAEGGSASNFDNIVSYEWDQANSRWIVESRDLINDTTPPALQNGGATENMFSFAFFQATKAPTIAITSPTVGTLLNEPATFTVTAAAADEDGSVTQVEFLLNGVAVATDTTAPYELVQTALPAGSYRFVARVTDNDGYVVSSQPVEVAVNLDPGVLPANTALWFDGVDDHLTMGVASELSVGGPPSNGFTIECWFRKEGAGVVAAGAGGILPLISKGRGEVDNSPLDINYAFGVTPEGLLKAQFEAYPVNGVTGGADFVATATHAPIIDGQWHHAAVTYDGNSGTWAFYLDGADAGSVLGTAGALPRYDSLQPFGIATTFNSNGVPQGAFPGVIDEVRIWNHVRSAGEIMALKQAAIPAAGGLVGRFGLNEATGIKVTSSAGLETQGTMAGAAVRVAGAPLTNEAPRVMLTSPLEGTALPSSATVVLAAAASDADGTVALVEFYEGVVKLGEAATEPFLFNWVGVAAGSHVIRAVATDNAGAVTSSDEVTFLIQDAPALLITEVQSSQSATAPAGARDYWELTNFSANPIVLEGYTWDDSRRSYATAQAWALPVGAAIAAGESVIFTTADPAEFRTWWGVPLTVQVFQSVGAPELDENDGITLYDGTGLEVTALSCAANGFTLANGLPALGGHAGASGGGDPTAALSWDPASGVSQPRYAAASSGLNGGATAITGSDVGSPGGSGGAGVDPATTLLLTLSPYVFSESAANPAATGTLTRTGSTAAMLEVNLVSSDASEVVLPASVVIPEGQTSVSFSVTAVNDFLVDGNQRVLVAATAAGSTLARQEVLVLDDGDVPPPDLMITEVQSNQSAGAPGGAGDYFELTNFGAQMVSLEGFTWDDDSRDFQAAQAWALPAGASLAVGESAVITAADPAVFRAWWGLDASVKVYQTPGAPGLGQNDGIEVFTNNGVSVTFFTYAAGGFTRPFELPAVGGHAGPSAGGTADWVALIWDPTTTFENPRYTAATGYRYGTRFAATGSDVGSPGVTNGAPVTPPSPLITTQGPLQFEHVSTMPLAGAEITAFDPSSKRMFVTSNVGLQVLAVSDAAFPVNLGTIDFTLVPFSLNSTDVTSVSAHGGVVAVAVPNAVKELPGSVVFLNAASGAHLGTVTVGVLPDMITFTPNGLKVLTANEGEVLSGGLDPAPGTVSIIDVSGGFAAPPVTTVGFTSFDAVAADLKAAGVRIFEDPANPGTLKLPSLDFEPEYVAVSADSTKAMVTLQEANAVALLDLATNTFTAIQPLGEKDFSSLLADFSDRDAPGGSSGITNLTPGNPVFGLYMPDAIASFTSGGETFYVTANEGDDRDDFLTETIRLGDASYVLDPTVFPNAAALKENIALGRLTVSNAPGLRGDTDGDTDVDRILVYGGRSISILNASGQLVYDSDDLIERAMAELGTPWFDDSRSDNKGPEPEGVTIGEIDGRIYAFVGLERSRGVMVFDVTNPTGVVKAGFVSLPSDLNPEGLTFIPAAGSPTGKALLAVANETSNTLSFFNVSRFTLQVLHLADGEAGLLASQTAPNLAALVDAFEEDYANTLILSGGDNFIPSPFLSAGTDPLLNTVASVGKTAFARPDIAIHNLIGVEASAIGNHEWDLGSGVFVDAIRNDGAWLGAQFPHLSLNLDYSADSAALGRFTDVLIDGVATAVPAANTLKGRLVPTAVVTKGGEKIGLVGVTTQILASISSPSGTVVKGTTVDDMDLLAAQIQPYVNELVAEGVNKIILLSHLQQLTNEQLLATKLAGVDIILAAGSNTRLGDADDVAVAFPGHAADFANDYPLLTAGTDAQPVLIVNTDNEFTYLGRLVVDFDLDGHVVTESLPDYVAVGGAYASTAANVAAAWGVAEGDLMTTAFAPGTKGAAVKAVTDAVQTVINAKDGNVFGYTAVYLEGERSFVRSQETNLGNLTADANQQALRAAVGGSVPIVSLKNGGGIRAQIGAVSSSGGGADKLPPPGNPAVGKVDGGISQLDIENALRFNNRLMVFETTPVGLKTILEHGVAAWPNQGRFPQIGGVQFAWDPSLPAGNRITSIALLNDDGSAGAPLFKAGPLANVVLASAPQVIQVITLNFMANDGDGYPMKANGTNFRYLLDDGTLGPVIADQSLNFTVSPQLPVNALGEQAALAGLLMAQHGTLATAYRVAETTPEFDERIQNLNFRTDTVPPVGDVDSDGDGLSDLEEVLLGGNPNATLRVADRLDLNLGLLTEVGQTLRLFGKLPKGVIFNAATGMLSGVITGTSGLYDLQVVIYENGEAVRATNLRLAVEAFPARLLAGYEALLEDATGKPVGILRLSVTKPGLWSASLDFLGMGRRAGKGSFELVPGRQMAIPQLVFKANRIAPETTVAVTLDADSALVTGAYTAATMTGEASGFRLASLGGSPPTVRKLTLALDAGVQNGVDYPAGFGWAKGTVSNRGAVLLKGQLGDAQAVTMTAQLGVTGQALVWVQPYRNKTTSYFGGVLAMPNVGQPPATVDALPLGAWWFKAADSRELSYDAGFAAPLAVSSVTSAFTPVKTALELETALGLSGSLFHVEIEGGGLSNALGSNPTLPTAFTLGSNFALTTSAPTSPIPVNWAGKAVKTDGGLVGTFTLTPGAENLAGKAATTGVLLPGQGTAPGATVGAGLIKVPVTGKRGAFRTSSLLFEN